MGHSCTTVVSVRNRVDMRVLLILALVSTSSAFTLPRRSALVGPRRLEKSTRLAALDGSVDPSWLLHVVNGRTPKP